MKFLLFLLAFIPCTVSAQLTNGGFEIWSGTELDDWQTGNLAYMPAAILPDSDAHAGFLSVRGQVVDYLARPYAPYLSNPIGSVGFVLTSQHDTVTGWYKTNLTTGDRFHGRVVFYDGTQYPIAIGQFTITSSVTTWTQFQMPVLYYGAGAAAFGAFYFTITDSTGSASGSSGSYFLLDDLEVSGP
jgi:hypothetical protein